MKINKSELLLHSVTRLLRRDANANIKRLLVKSHPSEIAAVVRQLSDDEGVQVMVQLAGTEKEVDTFVELEGKFLETYLLQTENHTHVAEVLGKMAEDEAAGLLAELDDELAQKLISLLKGDAREEVNEILQYGEETCGRIMAVNVLCMHKDKTAADAINEIQKSSGLESLFYIYIVDDLEKLVGVVSLRQILQVRPDRVLKSFMTQELIYVNVYDSQEKAADFVEEYNFVSLPVVDDEGVLVGLVTVDDVIDYIRDEAQEEVLQLAGVEPEAIEDFSYWRSFTARAFWYGLLFIGGVFCSEIVLHFFSNFPKETVFLCFAPLILRLGGSLSIQSMTIIDQGILNRDIERSRAVKAVWGQHGITLFVVLLLAIAVFAYGQLRIVSDVITPLGLSLGLVAVSLFAIGAGSLLPFIFDKLKMDPLQSSSRFVHFLMDALSLLIFFQFLWMWESRLAVMANYFGMTL